MRMRFAQDALIVAALILVIFKIGFSFGEGKQIAISEPVCRCIDGGYSSCVIHLDKHYGWFGCRRDEIQ